MSSLLSLYSLLLTVLSCAHCALLGSLCSNVLCDISCSLGTHLLNVPSSAHFPLVSTVRYSAYSVLLTLLLTVLCCKLCCLVCTVLSFIAYCALFCPRCSPLLTSAHCVLFCSLRSLCFTCRLRHTRAPLSVHGARPRYT